jgi:ankyrin repeat protein
MQTILNALLEDDFSTAEKLIIDGAIQYVEHESGLSLLHLATLKKQINIVHMLLEHGHDANIRTVQDKCFNEFSTNDNEQLMDELFQLGNKTPLHITARHSLLDIAKLLVSYGAQVNTTDAGLCTPLHWAAAKGDHEFVEFLLVNGANVNARDLANSTAIHEASKNNHEKTIRTLLRYHADLSIADLAGCTASDLSSNSYITALITNRENGIPIDIVH